MLQRGFVCYDINDGRLFDRVAAETVDCQSIGCLLDSTTSHQPHNGALLGLLSNVSSQRHRIRHQGILSGIRILRQDV